MSMYRMNPRRVLGLVATSFGAGILVAFLLPGYLVAFALAAVLVAAGLLLLGKHN